VEEVSGFEERAEFGERKLEDVFSYGWFTGVCDDEKRGIKGDFGRHFKNTELVLTTKSERRNAKGTRVDGAEYQLKSKSRMPVVNCSPRPYSETRALATQSTSSAAVLPGFSSSAHVLHTERREYWIGEGNKFFSETGEDALFTRGPIVTVTAIVEV
jgi:hypothetical protein